MESTKPMTAAQVAELFRVSPNTIRRWTDRGYLPFVQLPNGQRRYDPVEVRKLVPVYASEDASDE
jgi:excisionase family DNA binding protein